MTPDKERTNTMGKVMKLTTKNAKPKDNPTPEHLAYREVSYQFCGSIGGALTETALTARDQAGQNVPFKKFDAMCHDLSSGAADDIGTLSVSVVPAPLSTLPLLLLMRRRRR